MAKRRSTIKFVDSQAPLSEADLQAVEARLGISFPSDYRHFLRRHNGGRPELDTFHFKYETGPYTDSCVDRFYAIYNGEHDNFEKVFQFCKADGLLQENMIAVADDPGGNMICLSVSGPDTNSVYFWDHEAYNEDDKGANLHLLADSFGEFLDGLTKAPKYIMPEFDRLLLDNDVEGLKALIASGWNVNTKHEGRQDIPIEISALYGRSDIVEVLLKYGANVGRALGIAEGCLSTPHLAELPDRDYAGVIRAIKPHSNTAG